MPGIQNPRIRQMAESPDGVTAADLRAAMGISVSPEVPPTSAVIGSEPGVAGWFKATAGRLFGR